MVSAQTKHLFKSTTKTSKMSIAWLISVLLVVFVNIVNGSPAPPLPPVMTSHTEMIDMGHLKLLPAGTYPDYAAAALAAATENDPDDTARNLIKRSWQSLQGAWGKRSADEPTFNNHKTFNMNLENFNAGNNLLSAHRDENNDVDDLANGIDENNGIQDYQELLKYSEIYPLSPGSDSLLGQEPLVAEINEEKRGWKNRNMGWGKRRGNDWNKFRGSWGKREPSWNNLKGLWGKRAGNWNKLQSAWGKRNADSIPNSNEIRK